MTTIHLLAERDGDAALEAFAARFLDAVDAADRETRESGNYVGGEYVKASVDGLDLKIAFNDEPGFEEFRFWIALAVDGDADQSRQRVDALVDERRLAERFTLVRIDRFGRDDATAVAYAA